MDHPVYLDHAATTPVAPEVAAAMAPYASLVYGNAAGLYGAALEARDAIERAREQVALAIGAEPDEVYFTSGGSEADNWAVKGTAWNRPGGHAHILFSAVEHRAVLDCCAWLAEMGDTVETIRTDGAGVVEPSEVTRRISDGADLVSIMAANNEVGSVQPVAEIGGLCRERGVAFHVDAVQALGAVPLNVRDMNVDLMSLSSHKVYGPKGVGALYVRRGVRLANLIHGGGQESGRRAGTSNVPGAVGFGEAARIAVARMDVDGPRIAALRDRLLLGIERAVPDARVCGSRKWRLPGNAHVCLGGVEGEAMVVALDAMGVCASAGSACASGSSEPSHVLLAMGLDAREARGGLRLTLGRSTTVEEVDYAVWAVAEAASDLRAMGRGGGK